MQQPVEPTQEELSAASGSTLLGCCSGALSDAELRAFVLQLCNTGPLNQQRYLYIEGTVDYFLWTLCPPTARVVQDDVFSPCLHVANR